MYVSICTQHLVVLSAATYYRLWLDVAGRERTLYAKPFSIGLVGDMVRGTQWQTLVLR